MSWYIDRDYISKFIDITWGEEVIDELILENSDILDWWDRFWIEEKTWYQMPFDTKVIFLHKTPLKELISIELEEVTWITTVVDSEMYINTENMIKIIDTSFLSIPESAYKYKITWNVWHFTTVNVPSDIKKAVRMMTIFEYNRRNISEASSWIKSKQLWRFKIDYDGWTVTQENIDEVITEIRNKYLEDWNIYFI